MTFIFPKISKLCAVLVLCGFTALPTLAQAQNAVSFTVSPTIFDMTANPGQTWKSTVRIINTNPFELRIFADVVNFVPKGETGAPQFIPVTADTAASSTFAQWITTEKEIIIPPEKTIELPLTISVPADAMPGGHFSAIMISTKPTAKEGDKTAVQTSQIISSLLFLRVSGDVTESGVVRSFRTTDYFLSKPEATFELRIENKGNVHVQPQGEIKIFNMWGQERGTIKVNQQTLFGNVLPNSVRKYAFTWKGDWSFSDVGRYTAIATLAYGMDSRQSMSADAAFWVIPWKIILSIVVVVGGFIALVSWAIKAYVRRMLTLAGVTPGAQLTPVAAAAARSAKPVKTSKLGIVEPKGVSLTKGKPLGLAAPLQAGMLDLRARFSKTDTLKKQTETIIIFLKHYWKFFAVVVAIIIFVGLVIWFIKGAFTPSRDFEVIVETDGQAIKVSNDTVGQPAEESQMEVAPQGTTTEPVTISIINRSGEPTLTQQVSDTLSDGGYSVTSASEDFSSIEEKTVIVYDPDDAQEALALSELLDKALLSAFTETKDGVREIIIYVGSDTVATE